MMFFSLFHFCLRQHIKVFLKIIYLFINYKLTFISESVIIFERFPSLSFKCTIESALFTCIVEGLSEYCRILLIHLQIVTKVLSSLLEALNFHIFLMLQLHLYIRLLSQPLTFHFIKINTYLQKAFVV